MYFLLMTTYSVLPNDGGWRLEKNGVFESKHRKKSAAKKKARRQATDGDKLVLRRANGTIQDQRRITK